MAAGEKGLYLPRPRPAATAVRSSFFVFPFSPFFVRGSIHLVWVHKQCRQALLSLSMAGYTLSGFTNSAAKHYFLCPWQHTPCLGSQTVPSSTTFFVHGRIHLIWVHKQCRQALLSLSVAGYTLSGFTNSAAKHYFLCPWLDTPYLGSQTVLPSTTFFVHGRIHLVWVYKQCCQVRLLYDPFLWLPFMV